MHETGKRLFNLMFKPGETVCVSHNKFGYHSVYLNTALNGPVTLVPPSDDIPRQYPQTDDLLLVALNPIKGYRQDINCTAFRSFLIEMDYGPLAEQMAYVKTMGMPYSAVVFSGNKSLHFLITLDTDLPSENVYRLFSEWILKIMPLADQNTKNPSRSIRIPGAYREPGKQQTLQEFNGLIKLTDLVTWLSKYPGAKPKPAEERVISEEPAYHKLKPWIKTALTDGVTQPGRNKKWFSIAVEFALSGYEEDYTIGVLRQYFSPERDFKEKEWKTAIKSGFKWTYVNKERT